MNNKYAVFSVLKIFILLFFFQSEAMAGSSDIKFSGSLVAEPCTVVGGEDGTDVSVDFGTISEKTFYSTYLHRTWSEKFKIVLEECDLSLGSEVKVTFYGEEDAEQPGMLAISSSNGVKHIALGIQSDSGVDLPLNKQTQSYPLNKGTTELNFIAYAQASDIGVRNKSVGDGEFVANTTFSLEYP
ncbi:fimbrial protein [Rahnella laticis]|uniref:fimbrial protein n=1 Tax=Rahnella laticis TaxID=2787622 RepID=UPI0018A2A772|nr:fimbrial protein [Rahnella laticis]MBF7997767.1 type 1 fimbrial protein [Rahnella laticis]